MKYTPKYFSDSMPVWKKKKGTIIGRILFRPISFCISSLCVNMGIYANTISYFSLFIAVLGSVMFLFNSFICAVVGAFLINLWLLLDCVDGNIARSIKKQPYGEFADAISSYTLVPFMGLCVGVYSYGVGGFLFPSCRMLLVIIGAVGGFSDTLMRLYYQKFKNNTDDLVRRGIINEVKDERDSHSYIKSIKGRIESIYSTYILVFLIISVYLNVCDIWILIFSTFNFLSWVYVGLSLWSKARKYRNVSFVDENDKD